MKMYIVAIGKIFILAMLVGCSSPESPIGNGGLPSNAQNYQVEIINLTEPVYETIRIESIDQPNCNGTGGVDNVVERTMGINHSIELGLGLTVDIDGKLALFGTGVDLGAAISSELGYQYGVTESISRSITVRAAPNTHVVHAVKLSEVWESGTARVTSNGESIDIPFRSRANFSIDLIESAPVICPTGQSIITMQTQQNGLDCSFIDELLTKADVIQNLYDGQSLAGVQARLVYPVDVPAGWIVQEGSKEYYGPVHFDSGVVASFWSPNSCRPLSIGSSLSSPQDSRDIAAQTLGYANLGDFMRAFGIPDEVKSRIFVCPNEETWCLSAFEEPGQPDFHFKNVSSCTIDGKQANGTSTIPEEFDGLIKGFTIRPCK